MTASVADVDYQVVCMAVLANYGLETTNGVIKIWSILLQVMTGCRQAPSHYLHQCWLIISEVLWHSPDVIFTRNDQDDIYLWHVFENYSFKNTATSPRGQWIDVEVSTPVVHSFIVVSLINDLCSLRWCWHGPGKGGETVLMWSLRCVANTAYQDNIEHEPRASVH